MNNGPEFNGDHHPREVDHIFGRSSIEVIFMLNVHPFLNFCFSFLSFFYLFLGSSHIFPFFWGLAIPLSPIPKQFSGGNATICNLLSSPAIEIHIHQASRITNRGSALHSDESPRGTLNIQKKHGKSPCLMGISTINVFFS